ncbi:hypothetical protein JTB14_024758 [Gonioctena quinquepunctata]|nr:hypothetical protein JTB14_024758 [Gonioctena quinquepunctata]
MLMREHICFLVKRDVAGESPEKGITEKRYSVHSPTCSKSVSAIISSVEDPETTANISHSDVYEGISLQGRRLVDIGYFLRQIAEISKHPPFDCTLSDMFPVNECRMGLKTKIVLICRMCNIEKTVSLIEETQGEIP